MTVYKYLGYGVTNENGIAKLDHDADGQEISHSYVGVGAGEIDVVASLDNPVSEGSIVSVPYNVWDTLWYDDNSSEHEIKWKYSQQNAIVTESDNARVLDNTASTGNNYSFFRPQLNNTVITPSQPFAIEFKHITLSNVSQIAFNLNGEFTRTFGQLNLDTTEKTVKIVVQDNTVKYYVNNIEVTGITDTVASTSLDIRIRVNAGHSVTIKDFKVYTI